MELKATLLSSFPGRIFENTGTVRRDVERKTDIRNVIVLTQDIIIVSDFMHGIKSFDSSGKALSKLRSPCPPTAMTKMSSSRIAYLVPFDCQPETVFVDVDINTGKLSLFKSVQTCYNYRAIASLDDKTWVNAAPWWNGAGRIDVFNMDGEILKSYNHPSRDRTLLSCPTDMIVALNGDFIVADGNAQKVIRVDPKAEDKLIGFEFKDTERCDLPSGIACDRQGRIYLSDQNLNHVIVLSSDGTFLQTILDSNNGELCKPTGLFLFEEKLFVVEREGDVKVFQLTSNDKL